MKGTDGGVILLCGIPGSGKTESGIILAAILRVRFYDLDEIIAEKSGKSIGDIFARDGESGFRDLEAALLSELLAEGSAKVIALGGGTLESEKAREIICEKPVALIWLKADASAAAKRLETKGIVDDHPLLYGLRGATLADALRGLINTRSIYFALSDFAVDTERFTPSEVAELIAAAFTAEDYD